MRGKNRFELLGNVTKKPEMRFTPTGKKYCFLTIAENYSFKSGDEWQEKVRFISVIAWENTAERIVNYLEKGRGVFIEGQITPYTKEVDGKNFTEIRLTVRDVIFLSKKLTGSEVLNENVNSESFSEEEEVEIPF